jgi:tetratricopeptide (TPR) repeat protein
LIDWSYDILPKEECMLLRRLSVFAGGWAFEAAESVCSDLDVLTLLSQLVNKSLVTVDEEGDEPRYRLLETIRQYARDKLLETGEAAEMRNRHLDYYVQLSENSEGELFGTMALNWVNRLEAEYDNLRTAIEWGMDNDVLAVLRMAGALPNFWFRRGYESEAIKWIEEALAHQDALPQVEGAEARQRMVIIARAWQASAWMSFSQGNMAKAIAASATCATLARQLGNKQLLAIVLSFEAASRMNSGNFENIDVIVEEALTAARESGDTFALGMAFGMIGSRMTMAGRDLETAKEYTTKSLSLLKEHSNRFGYGMVLFAIGMGARFQGRFTEARQQFTILLPIFAAMGDYHRTNMIHSEMAHMERFEGRYKKAAQMYRDTIVEWKRLGHRAAVANQLECFAFIAKIQEQPERAAKLFGAAEMIREVINIPMNGMEQAEYDREVADLRVGMSETEFNALWAEGRAMTMEQAIQLALDS